MRADTKRYGLTAVWLVVTLLAAGLAGCGGGDGGAVAVNLDHSPQPEAPMDYDEPLPADEYPTEPPQELPPGLVVVGDSLPAFPGSSTDGPLSEYRTTSEEGQRVVDGDQRVAEAGSGNYPAEESDGYVIVPGGDDELCAWLQFSVAEFDDERPVDIYIVVDSAPVVPGGDDELPLSYWVGVANFTHYSWDWYGPYDDDQGFELNSAEVKDRFVSEDGVQYFVVLTLAGGEFVGEGNPQGLTAARVEFTRIDTLMVTDVEYFHTNPHYVWIDALELRDGYKGASALDPDTQYVTIEWAHHRDFQDANSEASLYQVQRQLVNDPEADPVLLNTVGAPGLMFVDPTDANLVLDEVVPGMTYEYYIRAQNPLDGFTPWSLARRVTIPLLAPPDLAASDGDPADELVLTWTKSEGATQYRIFRDGTEPEDLVITVGDVDTYTDTAIKDIDVHTYRMKAKNDYALSDWSNEDTGFLLLVEPVAILTGDPLDGEFPLTVDFDASDSHDPDNGEEPGEGIVRYEFQFDTGGPWVDNQDDPLTSHVYEERETYVARVRVTDNDGQTSICGEPVLISPNDPPVPDLQATPVKGEPPLEVTFDASGSMDDHGIAHYYWDFDGDGNFSGEPGALQEEDDALDVPEPLPYSFSASRIYLARVRVEDTHQEEAWAQVEINVNLRPTAVLMADPKSGGVPLTVGFDASDSYDPDNPDGPTKGITKYEFDFGEGNGWEDKGLNGTPPPHEYDERGDYTAKVRVWDNDDDFDEATVEISVGDLAICYAAEVDGQWGVYVMNSDGTGQEKLLNASDPSFSAWSPDKSKIAYTDTISSVRELVVVSSDGTGRTQITSGGESIGQIWWEDNEYLVYRKGAFTVEPEIYRIKRDGTEEERLTVSGDGNGDRMPVISPDGKSIAFTRFPAGNQSLAAVYVADYPSFSNARLVADVDGGSAMDISTAWSSQDEICLTSISTGRAIYSVLSDGSNQTRLTPDDGSDNALGRYSSDGTKFVYEKNDTDLWSADSDGSDHTQLVSATEVKANDWYVKRWPKAILEATPTDGSFPLTVDFDASDSYDMDNGTGAGLGITDYEWDFDGDGVFGESDNGESTYDGSDSASHTYTTWGVYRAWVRVTDDEGDVNTAYIDIGEVTWHVHTVHDDTDVVGKYSTVIGLGGVPAICYFNSTHEDLTFVQASTATPSSDSDWTRHDIESTGSVIGEDTSMTVVNGKAHVCFHHADGDDLRFARATVASPTSNTDWVVYSVDSASSVGSSVSLSILSGKPAIAYWDWVADDLLLARATVAEPSSSGDWSIHTLDSTGSIGQYCSLGVLDSKPVISYYAETGDDLKFARATTATPGSSGDWVTHAAATEGVVGQYSSFVVLDNGNPAICYFDDTFNALAIAVATADYPSSSSDWNTYVIDDSDDVGYYASMTLVLNRPAISYRNNTDEDLKFAWAMTPEPNSQSDWLMWDVDTANDVGRWASLAAIGSKPYISYYDGANSNLKLARGE